MQGGVFHLSRSAAGWCVRRDDRLVGIVPTKALALLIADNLIRRAGCRGSIAVVCDRQQEAFLGGGELDGDCDDRPRVAHR